MAYNLTYLFGHGIIVLSLLALVSVTVCLSGIQRANAQFIADYFGSIIILGPALAAVVAFLFTINVLSAFCVA